MLKQTIAILKYVILLSIWTSFSFTYHVSSQVNTQNGYGAKRKRNIQDDEHQERTDLGDVTRQCVGNGLLQVVKDQTTWGKK